MPKVKDKGYAPDRWAFDDKVTDVFEDMLDRSIPQHKVMRETVVSLITNYISLFETGDIYDIGCSRGEMISLLDKNLPGNKYSFTGLEISQPMYDASAARFQKNENVDIINWDLKMGLPSKGSGIQSFPRENVIAITSVLTLMFVPMEYRQKLLSHIYDKLEKQGMFILVEKVLGSENELNQVMSDSYYQMKRNNGYTEEDITRKKLSLEGVLVPVTTSTNIEMLQTAGFKKIDCFWRWMNFSGFVAIK
tara:strand:- start:2247 stop:2993 length:747 start_codon:yes stop_codon:yes gene_type:complete